MNLPVLEAIASGRAKLEAANGARVRVAYLSRRRANELREELDGLGVYFGIPLGRAVPHAPEEGEWFYLGLVLDDVHVFARVERA